jgi:vacuolar-type H+-ATPase subunit E/Vma4
MSKERIKELLSQLREEIRNTDVDADLEKLMGDLDEDISNVIDKPGGIDAVVDIEEVVDRAKEIEANFATKHPAAERFVREVIDLLVRMGI